MENGNKKTAVIIDTDPGVDDIIAILLALASPELEILAFIVTFGNTDRDACYDNILKTYQIIARHLEAHPSDKSRFPNFHQDRKTILARGAGSPLEGPLHRATYFHGRDGLSDISTHYPEFNLESSAGEPHPQLELSDRPGVDVALDLIRDCPTKTVTYIALGPLTTLAQIARRDAMLLHDRIGQVVCMGGALDVPGNVSPVAEFNFYADPFAVRELLLPAEDGKTSLPLDRFLLASLDITTSHELPFSSYQRLVDSSFCTRPSIQGDKTPLAHFTSSFLERTRGIMQQFGKDVMELHDIVAVWCAIDNPPNSPLHKGWVVNQRKFDVERTGELTRGMLVVDRRRDTTAYAPGVNRSRVQAELDKQGIPHGLWESPAVPAPVEVESVNDTVTVGSGVRYIIKTPGSGVLLQLLFERIWGVSCDAL
ncbi:nucleoside hydrolase [Amanita muscaria]